MIEPTREQKDVIARLALEHGSVHAEPVLRVSAGGWSGVVLPDGSTVPELSWPGMDEHGCGAIDPMGRAGYSCCYRQGHGSEYAHRFVKADEPPCTCGITTPDEFGNRDLRNDPGCPMHGDGSTRVGPDGTTHP